MNRAFSLITVKSYDDEERTLEGIATTPAVDRVLDVVEPLGGQFKLPLALLLDHDNQKQVGHVTYARPTREGIAFKAKIVKVDEPGPLKDLCDLAWQLVRYKLRAAVSIGFRALPGGAERMDNGGTRFKLWEWLELSLCSIPANAEALILSSKSIDATALAALKSIDTNWNSPAETEKARQPRVVRLDGPLPAQPEKPTDPRDIEIKRLEDLAERIKTEMSANARTRDRNNAKGRAWDQGLDEHLFAVNEKLDRNLREVGEKLLVVKSDMDWQPPQAKPKSAPKPREWEIDPRHVTEPAAMLDAIRRGDLTAESFRANLDAFFDYGLALEAKIMRKSGIAPDGIITAEMLVSATGPLMGLVKNLMQRTAELETRLREVEAAGLKYCGVHQKALPYRKGSVVTHSGSAWIALKDVPEGVQPIDDNTYWQLAIKRGGDGRDLPKKGKEVTRVTEWDKAGRIKAFERSVE